MHGHGQPDLKGIEGVERLRNGEDIIAKWEAYIERLRRQRNPPSEVICIHDFGDQVCPYAYAEEIFAALQELRYERCVKQPEIVFLEGVIEEEQVAARLRECSLFA